MRLLDECIAQLAAFCYGCSMRYLLPLLIFAALAGLFWKGLQQDPHQLPSAFINKPLPTFRYSSLGDSSRIISNQALLGHVLLLNVWATWCVTCRAEHAVLMDIAQSKQVKVIGLNYKDDEKAAQAWLKQYGNPYHEVIFDPQGTLGIDLGVYGTPETFVIDANGVIRYKHVGPLSPSAWREKIAPVVRQWLS